MANFMIDLLNKRMELKSFKVFLENKDLGVAEKIVDILNRATPGLLQNFGLTGLPDIEIYIYPDLVSIEKVGQRSWGQTETSRVIFDEGKILMSSQRFPTPIDENVIRDVSYIVFNREVKEREVGMGQWRTPAWLREGICQQVSAKMRSDSNEFLQHSWNLLQEAQKADNLIKLNYLTKSINMIPDPNRRNFGFHQAFFMVRCLMSIYCDKFFKKYSTLMGAMQDEDSEVIFRQITSFDYEKFFGLFKEWIKTSNLWAAISE